MHASPEDHGQQRHERIPGQEVLCLSVFQEEGKAALPRAPRFVIVMTLDRAAGMKEIWAGGGEWGRGLLMLPPL